MKTLALILRILLALVLLVFGSNKFFHFMPMEEPPAGSLIEAFVKSGYMIPLIGLSEVIPGLLLLINKWKGFALAWLVPVSVNIVLFNAVFSIGHLWMAIVVASINFFLIYMNWKRFKSLF